MDFLDNKNVSIIKLCVVEEVNDPTGEDRIQVRVVPDDRDKKKEELEWAFPFLPKMFFAKPKKGEMVLLLSTSSDSNTPRFYVAPAISTKAKLEYEESIEAAAGINESSALNKPINPKSIPETKGAIPNDEDIEVSGRKGPRLLFKDKSARLEAGTVLMGKDSSSSANISFNQNNPSYIKLDYALPNPTDNDDTLSTAAIVADKINLISYTGKHNANTDYQLTNSDDLIDNKTMNDAIEKAHSLPYGDVLVEVLMTFKDAIVNHTHKWAGFPATGSTESPDCITQLMVAAPDKDTLTDILLSPNIKID